MHAHPDTPSDGAHPERPLMATISELLDIPHFTTSRGGTVRRDFLEAVVSALGSDPAASSTKDALIRAAWEAVHPGDTMPGDRLSAGGTVTNRALQDIIDGILQTRPGLDTTPADPARDELGDDGAFDPSTLVDERARRLRISAARDGQNAFRAAVLEAYGRRCAITGSDEPAALQAAHIHPYRGTATNVVVNGLCLRADIHVLFDRGLIAIAADDTVVLGAALQATTYGRALHDTRLRRPAESAHHPSSRALELHRQWAKL